MADNSPIEWINRGDVKGATWNVITGCDVDGPDCIHCYAMQLAGTRLRNHPSRIGLTTQAANGAHVWTGEVRFNEQWLDQPLRWKARRMVFPIAHGDLFHENVPVEWIDKVFAVAARARWHTYQFLTKRSQRMLDYIIDPKTHARILAAAGRIPGCAMEAMQWPLPHVWLGVSAGDQPRFDRRVPPLISMPWPLRWLSLEPLIGAIDACYELSAGINWVVVGGESGPRARPMHPDWARSLRDQCVAARVPYFFKQHGAWLEVDGDKPTRTIDSEHPVYVDERDRCDGFISLDGHFIRSMNDSREDVAYRGLVRVGKKAAGRVLDGREWNEFPEAA